MPVRFSAFGKCAYLKSGMLAEKVVKKENHILSVDDLEQALELTDKDDIKDEESMLKGIYPLW